MITLKLVLEYDGTEFAGFQAQGKGERTVQSTLEGAIARISGSGATVVTAGRTDAGVHARGQVIHCKTEWPVPENRTASALNSRLPSDIAVRRAEFVDVAFHARFSAKQRTYVYTIWTSEQRSALWGRYSLHVPRPLNVTAMEQAASLLEGPYDFASFANAGGDPGTTTIRDLRRLDIRSVADGRFLIVRTAANGYLRTMVRNLVGCLLDVGRGRIVVGDVNDILKARDRASNPCAAAPPHGLCLWRVDY